VIEVRLTDQLLHLHEMLDDCVTSEARRAAAALHPRRRFRRPAGL
jgi:hypothetical protein